MKTTASPPARQRDLHSYSRRYRSALYRYEKDQAAIRHRQALQLMRAYPHQRILEVGCGMSPLFLDFAAYKKMTVVEPAADFYQNACQQLQTVAASRAAKVELINAYMEEIGGTLKDRRFDFVFVIGLLHEVPDALALLRAVRRAVATGAVLQVNAPNAHSFHRLLAVEMGLIKSVHQQSRLQKWLQQPRVFDMQSLRQLLKRAGFEVVQESTHFIKPFTHEQMATLQENGILTEKMQRGLENMTRHLPQLGAEIYMTARAK